MRKLEELEKTANMYKGLMDHTKRLLKAFFDLSQTHKGMGNYNTTCTWVVSSKTVLKIFVGVIPKEGLSGTSSAKPSLAITSTIELYSV